METTKIKLLRILDILRETDEEHPITANDIIKELSLYGLQAERKSVLRDIAALQDYGFDILPHTDNKLGWYMASREFEDWELKLLMDDALSAGFLTDANRKQLADKLCSLSSKNGQKALRAATPVPASPGSGAPATKIAIDVLLKAIRQGKKVGFHYVRTGADLKKHMRFDGHEYPVSPYALVRRQDRYFLIGCYGSYENLSYYRLERIRDIHMLDEPAVELKRLLGENADLRLREFINGNLNNYAGEPVTVRLAVDEERLDLLYDTFGSDFHAEKSADGRLTVRVNVSDGWGLSEWLLQHGDCVEVLEPMRIREDVIRNLEMILSKYKK